VQIKFAVDLASPLIGWVSHGQDMLANRQAGIVDTTVAFCAN
jgi:hypothetical protein